MSLKLVPELKKKILFFQILGFFYHYLMQKHIFQNPTMINFIRAF